MTVKMGVEQAGRFKLMVSGGKRGTIKYPWQKNLILDAGIIRLLGTNGSVLQFISVGAGSTAPAVGQTQLVSKIAHTNRNSSFTNGYDSEGGYGWTKFQVQFNKGAAAGNISELGVGWDGTNLWSRALVLNAEGNPTTITVLPDEFLTVIYELRSWYIVPEPHTITYDFDGIEKETLVTYHAPTRSSAGEGAAAIYNRGPSALGVEKFTTVSGFSVGFSGTYTIAMSTDGISNIRGYGNAGVGGQLLPFGEDRSSSPRRSTFCTFTPKIEKTNEFEVTITGTLTMSRRAE